MEVENKMSDYQLKGKVVIAGKIFVRTGLSIGGSRTSLDIGGMVNPAIKDSKGIPYIPGSSLKGKMRSLLEQSLYPLRYRDKRDGLGYFDEKKIIHYFEEKNKYNEDPVAKIFGVPEINEPGRAIFRDAFLDINHFEQKRTELFKNLELEFTEDKSENTIDRISAAANPRHLERVPPGACFNFEIIFDLYSKDDKTLLISLFQALKLLEDDYLGGSGSRGSGKITFEEMSMIFRSMDFYKTKKEEEVLAEKININDIKEEKWFTNVLSKINI